MSVISDIKMILESNNIHLIHDAKSYLEQIERWDAIKDADLVEVVRCKDCKHYSADGWGYGNCYRRSVEYLRMADNGFCSKGERRQP